MNVSHAIEYGDDETVTVTPIDANHCPGAAMFLFEGHFGRILHTGDFRYSGPMLNDITLHSMCSANIDVLFLDNTFCDARCIFPTRESALVEILRVIRSHPDARIKIGLRNLGKEEMLVAIARGVGEWIGVSQERYHLLEILCMANVFKVSSTCRIQVVMMSEITVKRMTDWNLEQQTIAIIPTGISIALNHSTLPQREDVHIIPYSNHCSYEELQQFVSLIEPRKIVPILGPDVKDRLSRSLPNRADMSCFHIAVGDIDRVYAEGNNVDVLSQQQASVSLSCSTSMDESTVATTRPKTRKLNKTKGVFSFKKKMPMGVVFSSSPSPVKRTKDMTNGDQPVVTAADSASVIAEQGQADCDADAAAVLTDLSDAACDTTLDIHNEEDQNGVQFDEIMPGQCDSVRPSLDDSCLMNAVNAENDPPCAQNRSAVSLDSLDNVWMLRAIHSLISKEADKITCERHRSRRSFPR